MYVISIQAGQKFVVQQQKRLYLKNVFPKVYRAKMAPESKANISNKKMIRHVVFFTVY